MRHDKYLEKERRRQTRSAEKRDWSTKLNRKGHLSILVYRYFVRLVKVNLRRNRLAAARIVKNFSKK